MVNKPLFCYLNKSGQIIFQEASVIQLSSHKTLMAHTRDSPQVLIPKLSGSLKVLVWDLIWANPLQLYYARTEGTVPK